MIGAGNMSVKSGDGLLGCKDVGPIAQQQLKDWAHSRHGASARYDDSFALWVFGQPSGGLRRFGIDGLQGWLLGDLFPGEPCSTPIEPKAVLAGARHTTDHHWIWNLTGQFALVLWDSQRRELVLYRDGSSAQSLYYHHRRDDGLVFSDRLDLLVACPLVPRRLSRDGLHEYLRFLDISSPNTIYDAVYLNRAGPALPAWA